MCYECACCFCNCRECDPPAAVAALMPVEEQKARASAVAYRKSLPVEIRPFVIVRWEDFL